jgi:hypothetical protein
MSELMTQNMPEPKEPGLYLIAGETVLPTVVVRCTDDLDKELHWMMVGSTWMYNWEGILFEWLPSDIAYTIESLTEHDKRIRRDAWREGHSAGEYDRMLGNIDISPNPYEIE